MQGSPLWSGPVLAGSKPEAATNGRLFVTYSCSSTATMTSPLQLSITPVRPSGTRSFRYESLHLSSFSQSFRRKGRSSRLVVRQSTASRAGSRARLSRMEPSRRARALSKPEMVHRGTHASVPTRRAKCPLMPFGSALVMSTPRPSMRRSMSNCLHADRRAQYMYQLCS
jgi:hypothetical protein